jgi:signal transduction histidine kinase
MSKEFVQSVKISGVVGVLFGLAFSILMINQGYYTGSSISFTLIIITIATSFSLLSSSISFIIDKKLKNIHFENEMNRRIINFLVIMIFVTILVSILTTVFSEFISFQIPLEIGIVAAFFGFMVGFVIMYLDYKSYKTKQKILVLEKENMFLNEISYKDELYQETVRNLVLTEERNRMAKELHDSIAQGIHAINYSIRALKELHKRGENLTEVLDNMELTTKKTLDELRAVILELQPSELEKKGLIKAIKAILDLSHSLHGIEFSFHFDYKDDLTANQEMAAFRIVQESIANIEKHSNADKVILRIISDNHEVKLSIIDNGVGFDTNNTKLGFGIMNMKDRSSQSGGKFSITSGHEGTSITVIWNNK